MEQPQNTPTRKKFLLWGAAIISSVAFFKIFTGSKKTLLKKDRSELKTVKMLTQDGRLVEIDKNRLTSSGKKITDEELQRWINK